MRRSRHRICVFTGSNPGARPEYAAAARRLGEQLAARGQTLVYGGAGIGLMGVVADAVLAAGGQAIGVIPQALVAKEVAHRGLSDLRVVASMHDRKALMAELADAFIALPGGIGTLEEYFEITTWAQLGLHDKPCGLLNAAGYYDGLIRFLDHAVDQQFVRPAHRAMMIVDDDPASMLDRFEAYRPPAVAKWITEETI
jgi:uncharacterized protein (TIGR00730 family)